MDKLAMTTKPIQEKPQMTPISTSQSHFFFFLIKTSLVYWYFHNSSEHLCTTKQWIHSWISYTEQENLRTQKWWLLFWSVPVWRYIPLVTDLLRFLGLFSLFSVFWAAWSSKQAEYPQASLNSAFNSKVQPHHWTSLCGTVTKMQDLHFCLFLIATDAQKSP